MIQYAVSSQAVAIILARFIQPTKSRITREHVNDMSIEFVSLLFKSSLVSVYCESIYIDILYIRHIGVLFNVRPGLNPRRRSHLCYSRLLQLEYRPV